jgi:hypothetical protein
LVHVLDPVLYVGDCVDVVGLMRYVSGGWSNAGCGEFRTAGCGEFRTGCYSRHRLVRGSRSPCKTRHLLCQMLHVVLVNVAVHPASQRVLMEMSDEWESPGTMWARVAIGGRPGMFRLHVWVDCRTEPSGMVTVMGLLSICLLMTCACARMKWPVAPVSPRAYCVGIGAVGLLVVGGVSSSSSSSLRRAKRLW